MDKPQIIELLRKNHQEFISYLAGPGSEDVVAERNGKWTDVQHLHHIVLSVTPINRGLILPAFLLKLMLGKANRPSKPFEQLVAKYRQKLSEGGRATAAFIPPKKIVSTKENMLKQLSDQAVTLCRRVNNFSEQQLDAIILPHPLLGKVTLREMLYFTIYHVQHHKELVQKNLEQV